MSDRLDAFGQGTEVRLITFTDPGNLDGYQRRNDLRFDVLVDPDRLAYRAFGLDRGSPARVWGWRAARRYLELIRSQGVAGLRRPTEDTLQLGGDFVIDRDGRLAWGFWGEGPDDRPAVDQLIDAVREAS